MEIQRLPAFRAAGRPRTLRSFLTNSLQTPKSKQGTKSSDTQSQLITDDTCGKLVWPLLTFILSPDSMKRRREAATSSQSSNDTSKQSATSPDRALRSKRGSSDTPAKSLRSQPSTPAHMSMRTAAKAQANSQTASIASATSRRSSLADSVAVGAAELGDEPPAKRTRLSSAQHPSPVSRRSSTRSTKSKNSDQIEELIPDNYHVANGVTASQDASQGTSQESVPGLNDIPMLDAKVADETPSGAVTPEVPVAKSRRGHNLRGRGSRKRGRGGRPRLVPAHTATPTYSTDAASAPGTPKPPADEDAEWPDAGDGPDAGQVVVKKRLPGRRRAPHADPSIEADLRRQLHLKMGYRAIAKALKPILAELAERSIEEIEENPEAHTQHPSYRIVEDELEARVNQRISHVDAEFRLRMEELERIRTAEEHIIQQQLKLSVENLQENYLLRCEEELLRLQRLAAKADDEEDATDDEAGPVPPQRKRPTEHFPIGEILDESHKSRSRDFILIGRLWEQSNARAEMRKEVDNFQEKDEEFMLKDKDVLRNFANLDPRQREMSLAILNAQMLAKAAKAVQDADSMPPEPHILPNEEAFGLQALAMIAEQAVIPHHTTESHQPQMKGRGGTFSPAPDAPFKADPGYPRTPEQLSSIPLNMGTNETEQKNSGSPGKRSYRRSSKATSRAGSEGSMAPETPSRGNRTNIMEILNEEPETEPSTVADQEPSHHAPSTPHQQDEPAHAFSASQTPVGSTSTHPFSPVEQSNAPPVDQPPPSNGHAPAAAPPTHSIQQVMDIRVNRTPHRSEEKAGKTKGPAGFWSKFKMSNQKDSRPSSPDKASSSRLRKRTNSNSLSSSAAGNHMPQSQLPPQAQETREAPRMGPPHPPRLDIPDTNPTQRSYGSFSAVDAPQHGHQFSESPHDSHPHSRSGSRDFRQESNWEHGRRASISVPYGSHRYERGGTPDNSRSPFMRNGPPESSGPPMPPQPPRYAPPPEYGNPASQPPVPPPFGGPSGPPPQGYYPSPYPPPPPGYAQPPLQQQQQQGYWQHQQPPPPPPGHQYPPNQPMVPGPDPRYQGYSPYPPPPPPHSGPYQSGPPPYGSAGPPPAQYGPPAPYGGQHILPAGHAQHQSQPLPPPGPPHQPNYTHEPRGVRGRRGKPTERSASRRRHKSYSGYPQFRSYSGPGSGSRGGGRA
ncbi:hypothetical protein K402DRAFT_417440 [Aulographum hederae CBS 113979]|uniref:Uncharacterized protein n=1 Tax=Aulographum hederae CBS 113979 TaxID=1176131 RepID=A0A6G1HBT0_9PEZI|nr:hypothetical protein K402DRAFT_417440 [Aulographum hederae CBS 113979]